MTNARQVGGRKSEATMLAVIELRQFLRLAQPLSASTNIDVRRAQDLRVDEAFVTFGAMRRTRIAIGLLLAAACSEPSRPRSIAITVSQSSIALVRGTPVAIAVTVTRANFTGSVALVVSGLPPGVSAAFAPSTLDAQQTSATLTITPATNATLGSADLTVTASGGGVASQSVDVRVTVGIAGTYAILLAPASRSIEQGDVTATSVNIVPTGGFAELVALSVSGMPTNGSATLSAQNTSGAPVTLAIDVGPGTAPGTYPLTVTGTAPGLSDRSAQFALTVTAASVSTASLSFCSHDAPIWVAVRNQAADWTRITPVGNTYTIGLTNRTSIAIVRPSIIAGGGYFTQIFHAMRDELQPLLDVPCRESVGTKQVNGSFQNITAGRSAQATISRSPGPTVQDAGIFGIVQLPDRPVDVVALEFPTPASTTRFIIRRDVNPAHMSTMAALNFSTESFAASTHSLSIMGTGVGDILSASSGLETAGGTRVTTYSENPATAATQYFAVPLDRLAAGDFQWVSVAAAPPGTNDNTGREYYFTDPMGVAFGLGPQLSPTTVTLPTTAPYPRFRVQLVAQPAYVSAVNMRFERSRGASFNIVEIVTTGLYAREPNTRVPSEWDVTIPDLSAAAGFSADWMPGTTGTTAIWTQAFDARPAFVMGARPLVGEALARARRLQFYP